jgi:galactoside O-acetyltransferase
MTNSFYTETELTALGLKCYGSNVLISKKASLYSPASIEIGSHVRIDDFCILSGNIKLGSYIHLAAQVFLFAGSYGITMEDFSGISSRCVIYAESDDYSGEYLSNPMCPQQYRAPCGGRVLIKRHSIIGSGCTILPSVSIEEGAAVGAMSLVTKDLPPWSISAGIPCHVIKTRSRKAADLGREILSKKD